MEFWGRSTTKAKRSFTAECKVTDLKDGKEILLGKQPFSLENAAEEMKILSFKWDEPILWLPDDPRLLTVQLVIREKGEVIDETFPIRFGFREVWTEDGHFWLNGVRMQAHGQCHSIIGANREQVANNIKYLRIQGVNAEVGYFLGPRPIGVTDFILDVADEKGFLLN